MYMDYNPAIPRERQENYSEAVCACRSDGAEKRNWGLEGYPLASVYAPIQSFDDLYDCETAFSRGTIFSKLDLPFMGESVVNGGNCRG